MWRPSMEVWMEKSAISEDFDLAMFDYKSMGKLWESMRYWQVLTFWTQEKNVHTQTKVHHWMGLNGEFKLACLLTSTMCGVLGFLSLLIVFVWCCCFYLDLERIIHRRNLARLWWKTFSKRWLKPKTRLQKAAALCSSKIASQDGAWYAIINSVGENGSWTSRKYGVMDQDQVSGSIESPLIIRGPAILIFGCGAQGSYKKMDTMVPWDLVMARAYGCVKKVDG